MEKLTGWITWPWNPENMPTIVKAFHAISRIFVLAVVVAGAWWLGNTIVIWMDTCASGGATHVMHMGADGACAGVSDGSYAFQFGTQAQHDELTRLEKKIAQENQRAQNSGTYVSVVYLMPAPGTSDAIEPVQTFIDQLEGAYGAQVADNSDNPLDGGGPPIQLLIASSGTDAIDYKQVDQIIADDKASQHVAAVAGIVISRSSTVAEVKDLTGNHGIPVVGSTITSADFDNIPGLVRVAASSAQGIDAVLTHNKAWTRRVYLMEDTSQTDTYSPTLAQEFKKDIPSANFTADKPYDTDPRVDPTGDTTRQLLSEYSDGVCQNDPTIMFAGRGRDLGTLIAKLAYRDCLQTPVTIVTGTDTTNMRITPDVRKGLESNVTVYYEGFEYPNGLSHMSHMSVAGESQDKLITARQGYANFTNAYRTALGSSAPSDQNNVAMAFDATRTSITAIRLAGHGSVPRPETVGALFPAIWGGNTVYGASGPIVLSANYTEPGAHGSNPVGKVLPVLTLGKTGVYGFYGMVQVPVQP